MAWDGFLALGSYTAPTFTESTATGYARLPFSFGEPHDDLVIGIGNTLSFTTTDLTGQDVTAFGFFASSLGGTPVFVYPVRNVVNFRAPVAYRVHPNNVRMHLSSRRTPDDLVSDYDPAVLAGLPLAYVPVSTTNTGTGANVLATGPTLSGATLTDGTTVTGASVANVGLNVTSNTTIGINLTSGTFTGPAVRVGSGQAVGFVATNNRNLYFDNSGSPAGLKWSTGSVASPTVVTTIGDNGTITSLTGVNADGPAATGRGLRIFSAGLQRWGFVGNATAEGGSNAGTDLDLIAYDDTGVVLVNPVVRITRSTGLLSLNRGLSTASAVAPGGVTDLSRHIALFSTTYGLNVTLNRQNYVAPTNAAHVFVVNAVDVATINAAGVTVPGVLKTTASPVETAVAMGANNIDLSAGSLFTKTISGLTTLTVSNVASAGSVPSFILELTNGGSATVTWFAGAKWAGGTAPSLTAAGLDILGFYTTDGGTTWRGNMLSKDSK